jgi:hypothetical protein
MANARKTGAGENGRHGVLGRLVGNWRGITRTWFEPGKLADESEARGRIRAVLDGRFVVHEYEGSLRGKPLMGMAILGYHVDVGRFTMAWVDSFHMGTATMHAEGEPRGDSAFHLLGHYDVPESAPWGWRTEFTLSHEDARLVITAFNISPGGREDKTVETIYERVD